MQIIEFCGDTLRFLEAAPDKVAPNSLVWAFLDQSDFSRELPQVQALCAALGGSALLELHALNLANAQHPSQYDYTSVYDLVVFRRLATQNESQSDEHLARHLPTGEAAISRIHTRAVGFAVFDRLLVSVHPQGCYAAKSFVDKFLADAKLAVDVASARNRLPTSAADLALRMVNVMVDSYLELRKELTAQLEHWQDALLAPNNRFNNWKALMGARARLHTIEDLCEEQRDALQEWLDALREQPIDATETPTARLLREQLVARAKDVVEHIERVVHHVRRLEQNAETVVQIHFSAQGNRTNDIMRTLTALTAIFLPLNLIAGIFGMNFEVTPLLKNPSGFWWAIGAMVSLAIGMGLVFWRKRYLARTRA